MDTDTLSQTESKSDLINLLVAALYTGRYPDVIRAVYHSPVPLSCEEVLEAVQQAYAKEYRYNVSESKVRQPAIDNIIDHLLRSKILLIGDEGVFLPPVIRTYLSDRVSSFQNTIDR